jgi:hypothetical protein
VEHRSPVPGQGAHCQNLTYRTPSGTELTLLWVGRAVVGWNTPDTAPLKGPTEAWEDRGRTEGGIGTAAMTSALRRCSGYAKEASIAAPDAQPLSMF